LLRGRVLRHVVPSAVLSELAKHDNNGGRLVYVFGGNHADASEARISSAGWNTDHGPFANMSSRHVLVDLDTPKLAFGRVKSLI